VIKFILNAWIYCVVRFILLFTLSLFGLVVIECMGLVVNNSEDRMNGQSCQSMSYDMSY